MDRQADAYRLSDARDWADDTDLCDVYRDTDPRPIRTPAEWEAGGWDAGRDTPKTLTEAKAALLLRVANPDAPDTPADLGAYDHLGS